MVDTAPLRQVPDPPPSPLAHPPKSDNMPEASPQPIPTGSDEPRAEPLRNRRSVHLWFLLPVSAILVALLGVLMPAVWNRPVAPGERPPREAPAASCALPSSRPDLASTEMPEANAARQAVQEANQPVQPRRPFTYRALWPFSPMGKRNDCEVLAQLGTEGGLKSTKTRTTFYPPWIAYLSLEASSTPGCDLDTPFGMATDAIEQGKLSGRGYAFLSIYYSFKRVPDRSRSFLEEALHASPTDPWVKLVEAVVTMRDCRDSGKAAKILQDLIREKPSFAIAQYHLARIYIGEEEYGKAKGLFASLEKAFPRQHGFRSLQQALAGVEHLPYYSAEKARGLLEISSVLSDLRDYALAGRLCRTVLEDMPNTLPKTEKKSAFYDLGRICELRGDMETAFTCYQNALRIDPAYRDTLKRMGDILKDAAQTS